MALYRPLDPSKSEIRLLEILGGDDLDHDGGPVRCRLSTVSLDDDPDFCALSYVWGDSSVTVPISIEAPARDGEPNGEPNGEKDGAAVVVEFQATINLEAALHKARAGGSRYRKAAPEAFRLWVDAVCINQNDPTERQHQVLQMRRVYKSARLVIGWLGGHDFSPAFLAIKTIGWEMSQAASDREFDSLQWMKPYPDFCSYDPPPSLTFESVREATLAGKELPIVLPESRTWTNVQMLFLSPYWERIWTLQEMALARSFVFLTQGTGCISWTLISKVADRMNRLKEFLQQRYLPRPPWVSYHAWTYLTHERAVGWLALFLSKHARGIGVNADIDDTEDTEEEDMPPITAWNGAMVSGPKLKASDPLDQIYGLLGVYELGLVPDYSGATSIGRLYSDFAGGWLRAHLELYQLTDRARELFSPLGFLHFAGIGRGNGALAFPSWVPNLHFHAHHFWSKFLPASPKPNRTRFGDLGASWPNVSRNSLRVRGVKVDKVETVHRPFEVNRGNSALLGLVRKYTRRFPVYPTRITAQQALLRLFYKDDDIPSGAASSVYKALGFIHVLRYTWAASVPGGIPDFETVLELLGWSEDDDVHTFNDWFVQRFFPGMDLGSLGFQTHLWKLLGKGAPNFEDLINGPGFLAAFEFDSSWSVFETKTGYIGLAPPDTRPGDHVYILDHFDAPVILRKSLVEGESHRLLVGACFVVGVMNSLVEDLVRPGNPAEEVEIR